MEAPVIGEGHLGKRLEESLSIPVPSKDEFWRIELPKDGGLFGGRLFEQFRKKLTDDDLADLRRRASQSPGKTLTEIQRILKDFPNNPTLLMLAAICIYGINVNSSNSGAMLGPLKLATKCAATALICDGVSMYNAENFLRLYRLMLERYKRSFDKLSKELRGERGSLQKLKLDYAESMIWLLDEDAVKAVELISHLKKRTLVNASNYQFTFTRLVKAADALKAEKPKEGAGSFNAKDTISFGYGLAVAFARIPILSPLVDKILEVIPPLTNELSLRRASILSVQSFSTLRIAQLDKAELKIRELGKTLFDINFDAMQLMDTTPVTQSFEADPFINLSNATVGTSKLFPTGEQARMLTISTTAIQTLIRKDQTKSQGFAEIAQSHLRRLSKLNREDQDTGNTE